MKIRKSARVLTTALGLAWATTASAQALPSPAAPASVNRTQAVLSPPKTVAAPKTSSSGVISAEHVFNQGETSQIKQTGHRRGCPHCQTYSCPPTYTYCEPCPEEDCHQCCLFNCTADAFDLSDSFWDAFGYESTIDFGGWTQFGYHSKNDGVFNTKPNDFQAQQVNLYVAKEADGSEGFDWGFRADLLYGTDAPNTQAFGNNPGRWDYLNGWDRNGQYGFAMPQLYGEVAVGDLNVKFGHFYTLLGYQVVPAVDNFFYSIPFTFNNSEAFTHTGVLGTYNVSDDVTVYAGWTLGWDTGFDQFNKGSSFLGGTSLALTDDITLTYICTAGNLGWIGKGYTQSIVLDWVINDKWEYVFQSDLVDVEQPMGVNHYDTIGVNQYLFYNFTDCIRGGFRGEWWKADGVSFYEVAAGVNFNVLPNVRIRPEVRHNWAPNDALQNTPFENETIGACDVIFTF